jgi:hypothetical protein
MLRVLGALPWGCLLLLLLLLLCSCHCLSNPNLVLDNLLGQQDMCSGSDA